ncbi:MAG: hypothetical protein Q8S35_01260, partial [bacterium]|nr:hypothetical protein [bacterium]
YLARANHTGTQLASTISDFAASARGLFSSSATGLTYTSGTGAFSLTAGYTIPLTASTTEWNTAYTSRIASVSYPLQFSSNVLSLAFGTTTANTWGPLQTFGDLIATNATTTNLYISGETRVASLTGLLKATAGVVTSAVAGTDYQAAGNYITALTGDITASGPGSASATLATVNANTGSFGSSTAIPTFTVNGKGLVTAAGTVPVIAPAGTLTGATLASNILASSLTSVGALSSLTSAGTITFSGLSNGLVKATSGVLSAATAGTDYENPLTFGYPLVRSTNTISLAFGTTTANTWGPLQTFGDLIATNATTTNFGLGSNTFTSLLGSGLLNTAGALTLDRTGAWTGTFDGQEGTWYQSRDNHSGTQLANTISDFATTARGLFSSSATGLTYTSGTGAFSLTAGYTIPLTASTTEWNTAYLNRITSATSPLSITNNVLSLSTAGDWAGLFDGQEGAYYLANSFSTTSANTWLTTKNTTNLAEGSNLYYTDTRSRAAISSSATGLTYTSGTGVFSLTAGYTIPLTASTTNWNTAFDWGNHASA